MSILSIPSSPAGLKTPDLAAQFSSLRQALHDSGDSRYMLTDEELEAQFGPAVQAMDMSQPPTGADLAEITLTELANIMHTRMRFPSYRSDLVIPNEVQQAVLQFASQSASMSQPITPLQPDNIPDAVAVKAIFDQNQNLPVPLTFTPQQNLMRRKISFPAVPSGFSSYPPNVRGLGVSGPLVTHINRYMDQMDAFAAFSDDPSSDPSLSDTSNVAYSTDGGAYVPVDTSGSSDSLSPNNTGGGGTPSSGFGTSLLSSLPSLLTAGAGVYAAANANPNSPKPVSTRPVVGAAMSSSTILLLVGGAALVMIMMSKKGGSRSRR